MNIAKAIINILKAEKSKTYFLVPGASIQPFIENIATDDDIRSIIATHEGGAVSMADGYARVKGEFATVLCIGGPGITNTLTSLYVASKNETPVLLISGEICHDNELKGFFQNTCLNGTMPNNQILMNCVKKSITLNNKVDLACTMNILVRKMLNPSQKGPVHLSVPHNVQQEEISELFYSPISPNIKQSQVMDDKAFEQAMCMVKLYNNIVIICGKGAERASNLVHYLSNEFYIPVITTLDAKGLFSENCSLSLGTFGWAGNNSVLKTIDDPNLEVVIVVGSKMKVREPAFWDKKFKRVKVIIQVDINGENIGYHFIPDIPIVGDSYIFFQRLIQILKNHTQHKQHLITERKKWIDSIINSTSKFDKSEKEVHSLTPIHPVHVIRELRRIMPDETILTIDTGAHSYFASHFWQSSKPGSFLTCIHYVGAMGWAIGAGIGAAIAEPKAHSVVITGDGCMLMSGMEIQTAGRYNIKVIFIVLNNCAHGKLYIDALEVNSNIETIFKLPEHDFAALARSLGVDGITVTEADQLGKVIEGAKKFPGPILIDVKVGNYPIYNK